MYKKNEKSPFKHLDFLFFDSIMLQAAFVFSYIARRGWSNPYHERVYMQFAVILGLIYICVGFFCEGYKNILQRTYLAELKSSVKMVSCAVLLMTGYMFLAQNSDVYSRYIILQLWSIGMFLVYMERIMWKSVVRRKVAALAEGRSVVLVSSVSMAAETLHELLQRDNRDFKVTGITLTDESLCADIEGIPVIGNIKESIRYFSGNVVDEVFIRIPADEKLPEEFIHQCFDMGLTVHVNLDMKSEHRIRQEVQKFGSFTVITACMNSVTPRQLFLKRFLDIAVSLVGVVFTGLLTLVIAPVVAVQSPGPVFFKQERVGRGGRHFYIYKFRSMYLDAEKQKASLMASNEMNGPIFKIENDPRVFPFGNVMRRWSLDEFPQFFNILKGDMSLVGTRPPTVDEYERYEAHHKKRLAAKPGLTGLWQISGRNQVSDFEEIVRLDSEYIYNWCLSYDIKILLHTVLVVLGKKGAR